MRLLNKLKLSNLKKYPHIVLMLVLLDTTVAMGISIYFSMNILG